MNMKDFSKIMKTKLGTSWFWTSIEKKHSFYGANQAYEYERLWAEKLGKIAELKWTPMQHMGLRDAFTMKYSMATQKELGFHTDASLVTGSVKLNDDFEGAELIFPHQDFSNINVPKGKCILFPSAVTHGHKVPELISGVKYSLTMWTSRYKGDVND